MIRAALLLVLVVFALHGSNAHAQAPTGPSPEAIRRALARYAGEPSVEAVVEAALAADPASPEEARRAARRARRSGLLPLVRVRVQHGRGQDRTDYVGTNARTNLGEDQDLTLEGRVELRLGRLVYAQDEIAWAREQRARESAREARVRQVIALYFERRRLLLERDLLGADDLPRQLRRVEIEALLDVLTNGEFGRMLLQSQRRTTD
jgi:hypothetical protein